LLKPRGTLLLKRSDIRSLVRFEDYVDVVEQAFRLYAEGKTLQPAMIHVEAIDGEFHIKAGGLSLGTPYFALKSNGGFFHNRERFGMPTIQGAILLCDARNGYPLAIMDSGEITMKRTGAAAAVAAMRLARTDSRVVTICGCGIQGQVQLMAMHSVLELNRVYVFDIDQAKAQALAEDSRTLGIPVIPVTDLREAVRHSDVCVTCTPSRQFYVASEFVSPGTFIAAMGADSPDKQELDPELLKRNKVVVDVLGQCVLAGELHHALDQGMQASEVYGELGEIIAGRKPGRTTDKEIIVFDSTGTALQDAAAAAVVYEAALERGVGLTVDLFE
jgi:alanine dehydrogenase